MLLVMIFVLNLNLKKQHNLGLLTCPQILIILYDWPVKYYFWRFSI